MKLISEYAEEQYEFVGASRIVLFDYCKTIRAEDFMNQNKSFGRGGSMRNLLVHIAQTYQYWVGDLCLKRNIKYQTYETYKSVDAVIELFNSVDDFMFAFMETMNSENRIEYEINGLKNIAAPFKIFSHVITHEYHHKGQILSISRRLGYKPVDTDIMREQLMS